jgi:signal transduction histidine kinase
VRTHSQTYGAITLYYPAQQQFTDEVIELAAAFGGQAALVIENARLRERVRETAAVEERNRLARDLHDAVTQTLFSASVIADTLPELWEIDRADAHKQLTRLGQLTRGALAEMRTLLIELRPARLTEADMHTLLQQLVDAADGRSKVDMTLNVQGTCDPPPDVKIVFYRIAQEALNNIVKHAGAGHAFVSLRCDAQRVTLQVLDDGRGFDVHAIEGGHFGVQIMGERAASVGANFVIDTHPGEGTEIQVTWRQT